MEYLLDLSLDDGCRAGRAIQLPQIETIPAPFMVFELDDRQEVGGVWTL